jgi:hypothetical protein
MKIDMRIYIKTSREHSIFFLPLNYEQYFMQSSNRKLSLFYSKSTSYKKNEHVLMILAFVGFLYTK